MEKVLVVRIAPKPGDRPSESFARVVSALDTAGIEATVVQIDAMESPAAALAQIDFLRQAA